MYTFSFECSFMRECSTSQTNIFIDYTVGLISYAAVVSAVKPRSSPLTAAQALAFVNGQMCLLD